MSNYRISKYPISDNVPSIKEVVKGNLGKSLIFLLSAVRRRCHKFCIFIFSNPQGLPKTYNQQMT